VGKRTLDLDDRLYDYLLDVSLREPEILARLRKRTLKLPEHGMQVSPEQGQFLALLVELTGARQHLEVGVFTGYSSLAVALALPADGHITALDIDPDFTAIAREFWAEAGVAEKIDLRLGPGIETLDALIADGHADSYDSAFIDADKPNYDGYFERCLQLVRPGGLIGIDNVLWSGKPADDSIRDDNTDAIRAFNLARKDDQRVTLSMVPIADGLTLAIKR